VTFLSGRAERAVAKYIVIAGKVSLVHRRSPLGAQIMFCLPAEVRLGYELRTRPFGPIGDRAVQ
jgi:hypothetical protein